MAPWPGLSLSVPRQLAEPWPVLASPRLPAGAGEIAGKGQNPARQEQKLSLVTHNWWNICSNFFFPFPSDLAPPAHAKKLLYPLDLPGMWRAEPLCGSWDGIGWWGRAGAAAVGFGIACLPLNPTGLSLTGPGNDLFLKPME